MALTRVTTHTIKDGTIQNTDISASFVAGISGSFTQDMTLATASIAAITASVSTLKGNVGQELNTDSAVTFTTVDTGQGANELYDMDQNVKTDSSPTFAAATITGTLTATEVHTRFVSASITKTTGSNIFGDEPSDRHQFTGSAFISSSITAVTGSYGRVEATNYSGDGSALTGITVPTAADISGSWQGATTATASFGRVDANIVTEKKNSLFGSGSINGTTSSSFGAGDADGYNYISSSATITADNNVIYRSQGGINIGHAITVSKQNGQARGSFPTTHGGTGVELGAILATIGSKGIPVPIRPGSDTAAMQGGVVQFIGKGTVDVGADITAAGTGSASEGGGGGGLVVIISDTLISGSGNIGVSGSQGHDTADAKGGGGGYSGEPGGHAGVGGCGGGAGGGNSKSGGAGGAGYITGKDNSGVSVTGEQGGAGGSSFDKVGVTNSGNIGGAGSDRLGNVVLPHKAQIVAPTPAAAGEAGSSAGGAAGAYGGGGGGGAGHDASGTPGRGGAGGGAGSGGGGGGVTFHPGNLPGAPTGGAGGAGSLYVLSSLSPYAGMPGGQGGGGGGGGCHKAGYGTGAGGTGGAGGSGIDPFEASQGNGSGGNGANGSAGNLGGGTTYRENQGGAGGSGGNGGGAAGLCIMIAPSITYSGTVTGRHIKIEGAGALKFIKGFSV